jgi:DNA-directed RNA polymerase specialized sigma24 family protein
MIGDVFTASFQDSESASRPSPRTQDAVAARDGSSLTSRALRWARAGDRKALEYLYARYADNVYGYVRNILGDDYEAEDVTRQVFARMIDLIGRYEERDVPFQTWILRVARNVALDHARRRAQPCPRPLASRIVTV